MQLVTAVGSVAAVLTTVAYVPQTIKTIRTRATDDLSLPTFLLLFLGTVLWSAYGFMKGDVPIIATNLFSLVLASIILGLKLTARPKRDG